MSSFGFERGLILFRQEYSLVTNSATTVETLEYTRKHRNLEGMGWIVTCLFIVGETAGGGLIALPAAMTSAGNVPYWYVNPYATVFRSHWRCFDYLPGCDRLCLYRELVIGKLGNLTKSMAGI